MFREVASAMHPARASALDELSCTALGLAVQLVAAAAAPTAAVVVYLQPS